MSDAPRPIPKASPSPALTAPALPPNQTIGEVGGVTMESTHASDFVIVAFGHAWVSGLGHRTGVFDARTGGPQGSVHLPGAPCGAPAAGFGAIWAATYDYPRGIVRIDPHQARFTDRVNVAIAQEESSLGAGSGSVWVMASEDGALCRIDPLTNRVTVCTVVEPGGGYGDLTVGNG